MVGTQRVGKAALTAALLWPLIGSAAPIYTEFSPGQSFLSGWSNSAGAFSLAQFGEATPSNFGGSTGNSYSTASSLFTYDGGLTFNSPSTGGYMAGSAAVHIDALVRADGTASGDLLSGILTVRAGATGIPELGAAAGDVLMVGRAIDSAASALPSLIAFLFEMTFEVPQLAGYGEYVTFLGALNNGGTCSAPCTVVTPWGLNFTNLPNYTFDTLLATRKVAEPASYALVGIALGAMGFATRRRAGARRKVTNHALGRPIHE